MKKTVIVASIASAIVAIVVLVVGLNFVGNSTPVGQSVGQVGADGGTYNSPVSFTAGASFDKSNELEISKRGTIGAGSNTASFQNTTARILYVDYAELDMISSTTNFTNLATASSSFAVSVGTSTTATFASSFVAPYATLIDSTVIATGTVNASINSDVGTSGNAKGTIEVFPGQYVVFQLRAVSSGCNAVNGCETATSTNRGFNMVWYAKAHYQQ